MSNVAVETQVIESANLLVSLDLGHDHVGVLFVSPLFAQKLVQVYSLECTDLSRVFNQLV